MSLAIANFILSVLTFIALVLYAYFTYLIAKDVYEPFVSFAFSQISNSHLRFDLVNKSKTEVEVYGKLWSKINNRLFEFKEGFYGNGHPWILQPFTAGNGHLELKNLVNEEGKRLAHLIKSEDISSMDFFFQIKYRKIGGAKWKKSTPQKFAYNFKKNLFWLNV